VLVVPRLIDRSAATHGVASVRVDTALSWLISRCAAAHGVTRGRVAVLYVMILVVHGLVVVFVHQSLSLPA